MNPPKIRRALISVYDKTGVVDFARALSQEFGVEIISTGGTAKLLKESGIPVTLVEEVTGFPEMLDGRVKTLHPRIHAAILADRDNPEHMRQLEEQGIKPIDMVVVNLYPFEKTVADPNCKFEDAIEMIDIGGPCLLRAAAKNHRHVILVSSTNGECLKFMLDRLRTPDAPYPSLEALCDAMNAFWKTSSYDACVASWMSRTGDGDPCFRYLGMWRTGHLRYGENPHQKADAFHAYDSASAAPKLRAESGQFLSFNNMVDADAALELCKDLARAQLRCGTGFQPVRTGETPARARRWEPVDDERATQRNLPHLETPGRTYFVTFRTRAVVLSPTARDAVLDACRFWHGKSMTLHAAVVMPDHVHLLLTPFEIDAGGAVALGKIIHSIKSFSANRVNEIENRSGALWQDERWDRIMRDRKEFVETWEYIETNPDRKELGPEYKWFLSSPTEFQESGLIPASDSDKSFAHRLEAGATPVQAPPSTVCTFVKHTNPCGTAASYLSLEAYRKAYLGDPNAAMGGILACSFPIDGEFASAVMDTYARWGKDAGAGGFFVEVWIAPEFSEDAVSVIRTSKPWGERVRLLSVGDMSQPPDPEEREYKSITGGMLVQTRDLIGLNEDQWKVVTQRAPSESEIADLRLAWLIAKHTKSNAISICKDGMLIGNGAGQMSRVMSCRIATWLAKENGHAEQLPGSAAASDAFFPFADGPKLLIDAGVTALIQPGGSKRDEDTIKLCDERGVAMVHTGTRHFKH